MNYYTEKYTPNKDVTIRTTFISYNKCIIEYITSDKLILYFTYKYYDDYNGEGYTPFQISQVGQILYSCMLKETIERYYKILLLLSILTK